MNRLAVFAMACATAAVPLAVHAQSGAPAPIRLASGGSGDALYLPYWSVEGEASTLLSVSNTRDQAKAVRVTLVGAGQGDVALSLNLYLAARDTWTAALIAEGEEAALELTSADRSCTLPALTVAAEPPPGDSDDPPVPDAPAVPARSGAVEIIELGVLDAADTTLPAADDCTALAQAFEAGGVWSEDANTGLAQPTGGLTATVEVVDEADATVAAFPATALQGFSARARHLPPDAPPPRLTEPLAALEGGALAVDLDPGARSFEEARGADAISALLLAGALHGEVQSEASLGAQTQWLVAFPTRHAYSGDAGSPFIGIDGCEPASGSSVDLDGLGEVAASPVGLCAHTQLVTLGTDAGSGDGPHLQVGSESGTATLAFDDASRPPLADDPALAGLPALGYRLTRFGQALPGQASDRAREATADYVVVQPLARIPLQADSVPPEPVVVPVDG